MMRRPVVLITGASGEIGHGLITRLAADGTRPILTLDLKPLDPELGRLVAREFVGSILDRTRPRAHPLRVRDRPHLPPRGAPLDAQRVHAGHGAPGERRGDAQPARVRAAARAQSHGRPVTFLYPSSIAAYGLPDLATKARAGESRKTTSTSRPRCTAATSSTASTSGATTRSHYKQLSSEAVERARRLPVRPFSRAHLGGHGAVRRHVRLRARDDPRGGGGERLRVLRPRGHADPVHGDAGRRRRAPPARGRARRAP